MNAVILVDLQYDFCQYGALEVPDANAVIPVANSLMPHFELVIATQDWHPANHKSFAANHLFRQPGQLIDLNGLEQILWPIHCVQGSYGAELVDELDQSKITKIFQKGTDIDIDSYSGFFDNGHRKATGLGDYLKEKGVTTVFVLGLALDYCVKFTALDAQALGFKTYLVQDACRAVNMQAEDGKNAIAELKAKGVEVIDSQDVVNLV